jgi:WD40 repeat protein
LKEKLSVWQDIVELEGGRDWWSQIENALKSTALQYFILIVTPAALASPVVRREIRLARQEGKTVAPIKGPVLGELGTLPRWLGHVYDLDVQEHFTALIRVLQDQSRQKRVAMMAPEPPVDFVKRPVEFEALKKQLLDGEGDSVAITAALRGAGGYGKTTLAKALAHDPDIQDAYFDGILWVALGQKPDDLLSKVSDLIEILAGDRPGLANVDAAAAKLSETLGERRILMIVDDVWREQDLRPFLQGGPKTTRLITTRLTRALPANVVFRQPVDAMTGHEALELLSRGLPEDQVLVRSKDLIELAGRLGEWAQLLKLVNGFLRERVIDGCELLQEAIEDANGRLSEEGLATFDADDDDDRTKAVARTMNLSLGLLAERQRARFTELAVFPEDADIPIGIVARLWQETAGLSESHTKDLLVKLYGLSLLLTLDLNERSLQFHDTIRRFLQDQAGKDGLVARHKQLLNAFDDFGWSAETDALSRRYFYLHLPDHLAAANERGRLDRLLLDPGWLKAKLAATNSPQSLIADYDRHAADDVQTLIGRTLRLSAGICARDQRQLIPQVMGRLMACEGIAAARRFLDMAQRHVSRPAILSQRPSLTPPGAESARLEGHSAQVTALCVLPDGRLASGSYDNTIRLWDLTTGAESARLEGHSAWVTALCVLPDGRLASGSWDYAILLWDPKTEAARRHGHSGQVTALCVLPDGRLASGSWDKTIWLWDLLPDGRLASDSWDSTLDNVIWAFDLRTGAETARLKGHSRPVTALCVLPDGRLASSSGDNTIRLWDFKAGVETARSEGHADWVAALCVLPDGRLASGSYDNTIRLWDLTTGAATARLGGHSAKVNVLCVLPDGRLASGSDDNPIRLWDLKTGAETGRLEGHSAQVTALCVLPDGRLASGSCDNTIRLWDLKIGAETTARHDGHTAQVNTLCMLPDGRLASGSCDNTIRLWDLKTGVECARLKIGAEPAHFGIRWDGVTALCVLPDGRLASGGSSYDGWIRLWDLKTGAESVRLEGHTAEVTALCVLPDGRLASSSQYHETIRLWDLKTGAESARLETGTARGRFKMSSAGVTALCVLPDGRLASGSTDTIQLWDLKTDAPPARLEGRVTALCVLPDGRLASGSYDGRIRLWDLKTGAATVRLEGHTAEVTALCVLSNGRLASGSYDNTIRLWDLKIGAETARLEIDAAVGCLITLAACFVAGDALGRLHWLELVD